MIYIHLSQFLKISEVEKVIWNDEKKYYVTKWEGPTYDIIIFKLKTPLKFNSKVQPACLPSTNWEPESNANCFVSGWGHLKFSEYFFSILPSMYLTCFIN